MTVAMAVAEATHHSAPRRQKTATAIREEVELETHAGLRAQMIPPPGARPGLPPEPGPQRSDRSLRRSAGDAPPLTVPVLAAASDEAVDSATLSFLVQRALDHLEVGGAEHRSALLFSFLSAVSGVLLQWSKTAGVM